PDLRAPPPAPTAITCTSGSAAAPTTPPPAAAATTTPRAWAAAAAGWRRSPAPSDRLEGELVAAVGRGEPGGPAAGGPLIDVHVGVAAGEQQDPVGDQHAGLGGDVGRQVAAVGG